MRAAKAVSQGSVLGRRVVREGTGSASQCFYLTARGENDTCVRSKLGSATHSILHSQAEVLGGVLWPQALSCHFYVLGDQYHSSLRYGVENSEAN